MFSFTGGQAAVYDIKNNRIIYTTENKKDNAIERVTPYSKKEITQFTTNTNYMNYIIQGTLPDDPGQRIEVQEIYDKIKEAEKRKLEFDDAYLVPALGLRKWDPHIFISGSTGSGKSYIAKQMLMHDRKRRKLYLVTDLEKPDSSLLELWDRGMKRIVFDRTKGQYGKYPVAHVDGVDFNGAIILFDDINDKNVEAYDFRDDLLERGRHYMITVVCITHKLRDWNRTRTPRNECGTIIIFPSSNTAAAQFYLKEVLEIPKKMRQSLIETSNKEGRHMILSSHYPNYIATAKSIRIL